MMIFRKSIICSLSAAWVMCGWVVAQVPDQEQDIRGPKELVEIPQAADRAVAYWEIAAACVVAGALAGFLIHRFSKPKPVKSPLAIAFASLSELERTRGQLTAEALANRAADTVRHYIAGRFGIAAPSRTTEEFFVELMKRRLEPVMVESDHLKAFLKSCDLVKFAGADLDSNQRDELIQAARGFITVTSAPPTPNPEKP